MTEFEYDDALNGDNDDDDEEGRQFQWGGRSATIFLIDAAKPMFDSSPDEKEESPFIRAIKCAHTTLTKKIISSDQDLISVIFFNTKQAKNSTDFPQIYIFQELERPGADAVINIEKLLKVKQQKFENVYGHAIGTSIQDALWSCQTLLLNWKGKFTDQNILLFTCIDDPHANDDQKKKSARKKARDLRDADISLEILHMGENFDFKKFYKDLIIMDGEDAENSEALMQQLANPTNRFEELMERVRRIDHKQRTLGRVMFTLAPGVEMGVCLYSSVSKMTKPSKIKLWKNTNEEIRQMRKEYLADTGELLMPSDYIKYQEYSGKKIKFDLEELKSLKKIYDTGIELLGFKNVESIKPYLHIRPANFLYPDEKNVNGSTKLFACLLNQCLARKVAAIVRVIPRRNASVSWAALLPQEEKLDGSNAQLCPSGFHVCFLPFADDFRYLELNCKRARATSDQVDAAKSVIKKLHFVYSPMNFDNPDIQTHWRNIEALALNRAELEPVIDYTVPNNKGMVKTAGALIQSFKDMVFPPSYDPNQVIKKRASDYPTSAAKREKPDPSSIKIEDIAKDKKVDKLTIDVLKVWLQQQGVRVTGKKKAELVQDVYDTVEINSHF